MLRARAVEVEGAVEAGGGRLADLYRAHAPAAARLAYLLTGDRSLAEDLVQEAFVRLFGRFRDLRNADAFAAYLRTTVVNLARSHFRRARVERAYLEREALRRQPPPPEVGGRQELWEALQRLSARQRAAIVLRYYEDLTEAQTADVLRCPVGTVKSLVWRGMQR
ncbi:MAG TPA: SigE family RNA polymerase sigma factor, partial [Actinomycetota bacterium]|nr:SigE family RNA polymerase sigma factor [Actinomycetota bacterium]